MATFQKRDSSWRAIIRRGGESISKSLPTKAEAIAWASAQEADIVTGFNGPNPNITSLPALLPAMRLFLKNQRIPVIREIFVASTEINAIY